MSGYTKGPWGWYGNGKYNSLYLATKHSGRQHVMGFQRWGMQRAQPTFCQESLITPAKDLLKFEVGDNSAVGLDAATADDSVYRYDIVGIDSADATLIAAAPELLEALEAMLSSEIDYMELNNLGNPALQHNVKLARLAIAKAKGES